MVNLRLEPGELELGAGSVTFAFAGSCYAPVLSGSAYDALASAYISDSAAFPTATLAVLTYTS